MKFVLTFLLLLLTHNTYSFTLFTSDDTYSNGTNQITDSDPHLSRRLVVAWHGIDDPRWNAGSHSAFIKFNTNTAGGVLDSRSVVFARLRLFVSEVVKEGILILCEVTEDWNEESLNGHNLPRVGKLLTVYNVTKADNKSWVEFDLTATVKRWLLTPETNYGIIISTTDRHDAFVMLGSKESVYESTYVPTPEIPIIKKGPHVIPNPIYTGPAGHPAFVDLVLNNIERD